MNTTFIDPAILNCAADAINCTRCRLRYTGEYCDTDLGSSFFHVLLVASNQVVSFGSSIFFLVWIAYGLYVRLRIEGRKFYSLAMITIYSLLVAIVLRMIGHFDMFNFYFITDVTISLVVLSAYLVFLISGTFLGVSVWFTIISRMKKLELKSSYTVPKTASIIIAVLLVILFTVFLTIGTLLDTITPILLIMTFVLGAASLAMIIMISYHLPFFSQIVEKTQVKSTHSKLRRMRSYLIAYLVTSSIALVLQIIPYCTYRLVYTPNDPEFLIYYASIQLLTRFVESSAFAVTFLLILDWFPYIKGEMPGITTQSKRSVSTAIDQFSSSASSN